MSEHEAIEAGRLLAVQTACAVLVMLAGDRYTIGLRSALNIRQCGQHIATVYQSGQVETECARTRWLRWAPCLCES